MTEIVKKSFYDKIENPLEAIDQLGTAMAKSGMLGIQTKEQGMVIALTCMQEGITPLDFARTYHIVEGRPTMRADAMQARFMSSGWQIRWLISTDTEAQLAVRHEKHHPEWYAMQSITVEKMDSRGITQGKGGKKRNWQRFPAQMLRARAVSEAVRMWHPQIVAGIYTPEEAGDFEPISVETEIDNAPSSLPALEPPSDIYTAVCNSIGYWESRYGITKDQLECALDSPSAAWGDEAVEQLRTWAREANSAQDPVREAARLIGACKNEDEV
jgi:hypothetical protein